MLVHTPFEVLDLGQIVEELHRSDDIGIGAKLLFQILSSIALFGPTVPGRQMRRGWRTSIDAGYTPTELRKMVEASDMRNFALKEALFDLIIHSVAQPLD